MRPEERDAAYLWDMREAAHPEVPWSDMIGQRNVLAHDYGVIDPEELWTSVSEDLPELIPQLDGLIPPIPGDND